MKTIKTILIFLIISLVATYSIYEIIKATEKKAIIAATYTNVSELEPGDQVNKVERRD
jgi:hypothetical protein